MYLQCMYLRTQVRIFKFKFLSPEWYVYIYVRNLGRQISIRVSMYFIIIQLCCYVNAGVTPVNKHN